MARTPSKPHIPYRGDDPSVGKKTGFRVARVNRTSDGYEPFNDLLTQANGRTPPRRQKKRVSDGTDDNPDAEDEDDEYGEESMSIDSPIAPTQTPRSAPRRSIANPRVSSVDFDAVPSPHRRKSVARAGPSRLSDRALLEQDEDEDPGGMDNDQLDDLGAQGVDYDDGDEDELTMQSPSKGKGKAVATPTSSGKKRTLTRVQEEEEDDMEDAISHGMQDVEQYPSDDEEEVEEEPTPPKKKVRTTPPPAPKSKQVLSRTRLKENRNVPEGVRRSQRVPYPPLEYWRNEKVAYAPRDPAYPRQVPHISAIIRVPKEPAPQRRPVSKRKRRPRTVEPTPTPEVEVHIDDTNPEDGWDNETDPNADVLEYRTNQIVTRRVAFTKKMFNPTSAKPRGSDDEWSFQKVFSDADFMAAGQIVIPSGHRKPGKNTKDNTYIFFVLEGAVNVVVCETALIISTGGMFMVPRGNSYSIENIAERDSKLFFTQARKIWEQDEPPPASTSRGVSIAMGGIRSGSSMSGGRVLSQGPI
ncbi:CENP-C-C domain-containing protein [Favolaschia claudopus]|uniref:CENP-C homolog n=1 Tax=Favolaschia claudopus TaxID=2862362 RepID=A0AAW0EJW4_9AGAR